MGEALRHLCAKCGRLVRGRCRTCEAARQAARPSASTRGYDAAWAAYAKAWLQRYPWCGQRAGGTLHLDHSRCVQALRQTRATCVDHIVAMKDGGSRMDPANHQSLCTSCNAAKARALEGFGSTRIG